MQKINPWFRMYHEFATDPKVQMLSEVDQRRYIMLLCLRCSNGEETLSDVTVTFQLRCSNKEYVATKKVLMDIGLIDKNNMPVKWNERQFLSDSSTERVKKYRAKRKEQGLPGQDWIDKKTRGKILKPGVTCVYCNSSSDLTIDHKTPTTRGGKNTKENLQAACRVCNADKGRMTHEEYFNWAGRLSAGNVTETLQQRPKSTETDTEKGLPAKKKELDKGDWKMDGNFDSETFGQMVNKETGEVR